MKRLHSTIFRILTFLLALVMLFVNIPMTLTAGAVSLEESSPFRDVHEGDYFYEAVLWAAENGIAAGTGGNAFFPNLPCIRAQVVTFLWRAMGKVSPETEGNPFADVSAESVYYDAILWAVEAGVTSGTGANTFSPNVVCTRAQVVTFLWRAMGKPQPESETNLFVDVSEDAYYYIPVLWAVEKGITLGVGNGRFDPNGECTRGQIVTFLYRTMKDE